jgi:hypothetical protein
MLLCVLPVFVALLLQVTAVMVTHAVEYSGHGDFTDSVLLDNINPPSSINSAADGQQHHQPDGQG